MEEERGQAISRSQVTRGAMGEWTYREGLLLGLVSVAGLGHVGVADLADGVGDGCWRVKGHGVLGQASEAAGPQVASRSVMAKDLDGHLNSAS